MSIHEKLFAVQQNLKAPKSEYNDFGKYKYRSCEKVLEALKPLLHENKLTVYLTDDVKQIGTRVYIEATATVCDIESGEVMSVKAYAREEDFKKGMDLSQVTGASSSYARKYALSGLFAVDDNSDSDVTNTGEAPKTVEPQKKVEKTESVYWCADCGKQVERYKKKDGKTLWQLDQYAAACMRMYGRVLCEECRTNAGKAN